MDTAPGARAIEVAAMLGDSVVSVKHCVNPRGGKVTRSTWGFVAGGVAALLMSATAFASAVHTEAKNDAAVKAAVARKAPAWSVRPEAIGTGTSVAAFGGLALGIGALAAGLARSRRERQRPGYRIGTAAGVEQPVESAPTAEFPMIAAQGDDFVFNFGAGMDGDVTVGTTTTPLAALVAAGHAKPSRAIAGALELPIPHSARIRARAGQTTFVVSAMAAPAAAATPAWNLLNNKVAKYMVGSLAVHLGILAFLQQMPVEDTGGVMDLSSLETVSTRAALDSMDDQAAQKQEMTEEQGAENAVDGAGAAMAMEQGAAGKPEFTGSVGRTHIKSKDNLPPQLARQQAIEEATSAGTLGSVRAIQSAIGSVTGDFDMSIGFDADNSYNGTVDGNGFTHGSFGGGTTGTGPGGGCGLGITDCRGIGTGRYGTLGDGDKVGGTYGVHPGHPGGLKPRIGAVPTAKPGPPTVCGGEAGCGLDKAIIRRYIMRSIEKVKYCYESELLVSPDMSGTVSVAFMISPDGSVQSSTGNGMNPKVASCVAGVVKNISFPKPDAGGAVQVNYPFVFRPAGK